MGKAFLFNVDTGEEKDASRKQITHETEELDQSVRCVGAGFAAQILHRGRRDGIEGRVKWMVRDKARHDKKKEPQQAYPENLFS